jgi:hypothetical protein
MFSRVVAVRTKEGKARQLATIQEKILPILEGQLPSWMRSFSFLILIPTGQSNQTALKPASRSALASMAGEAWE